MLNRQLSLPQKQSCLLLGPRQTGKSTLVRSVLPPGCLGGQSPSPRQLSPLHEKSLALWPRGGSQNPRGGNPHDFRGRDPEGPRTARRDAWPDRASITRSSILTGSSARKLKRRGTNLLAGRAVIRRLYPLTLGEQGRLFDLPRTPATGQPASRGDELFRVGGGGPAPGLRGNATGSRKFRPRR